jgi:hypothetical protein
LFKVERAATARSGAGRRLSYRYIAVRIAAGTAARRVKVIGILREIEASTEDSPRTLFRQDPLKREASGSPLREPLAVRRSQDITPARGLQWRKRKEIMKRA